MLIISVENDKWTVTPSGDICPHTAPCRRNVGEIMMTLS